MGNKNLEIYLGPKARVNMDASLGYIHSIMKGCECGHYYLIRGTSDHNSDCAIYNVPEIEANRIYSEVSKRNDLAVKVTDSGNK